MTSTAPVPNSRPATATQAAGATTSGSQDSNGTAFADLLDRATPAAATRPANSPASSSQPASPSQQTGATPKTPSQPQAATDQSEQPNPAPQPDDTGKAIPKDRLVASKTGGSAPKRDAATAGVDLSAMAATPLAAVGSTVPPSTIAQSAAASTTGTGNSPAPAASTGAVADPTISVSQPSSAPLQTLDANAAVGSQSALEPVAVDAPGGSLVGSVPAATQPGDAGNGQTTSIVAAATQSIKAASGTRLGVTSGTAKSNTATTRVPPKGAQTVEPDQQATASAVTVTGQTALPSGAASRRQAGRQAPDLATTAASPTTGPTTPNTDTSILAQIAQPTTSAGQQVAAAAVPQLAPGVAIKAATGTATSTDQPATALATPLSTSLQPAADTGSTDATATADTASPARQLAPALVQLSHAASGSSLTLRLDPGELGKVNVRIERGSDGTATVHVAVDRPETLRMLVADQPALHRALDSAGLSQDGRTLNLTLATPDTGGNATADGGRGGAFMGSGSFAGNGGGGGQQGSPWRQDRTPYSDTASPAPLAAGWLRAGVDITA